MSTLPAGRRRFRARAATDDERARLWPGFTRFPGWGDVDVLSARRPAGTAVVVLEPR